MKLSCESIQTPVFEPGAALGPFIVSALGARSLEGKILAVTSKIVSLAENRITPRDSIERSALVRAEADRYLGVGGRNTELTVKHGILIPSAGIDESNARENFILYPVDPYDSARKLYDELKASLKLNRFGVILTDSHTTPLRRGVTGIGLAHYGFRAASSRVGQKDLFGRALKFTFVNSLDALAATAVYTMGEGDECTPMALLEVGNIEWSIDSTRDEIAIDLNDDIYAPLWKKLL